MADYPLLITIPEAYTTRIINAFEATYSGRVYKNPDEPEVTVCSKKEWAARYIKQYIKDVLRNYETQVLKKQVTESVKADIDSIIFEEV